MNTNPTEAELKWPWFVTDVQRVFPCAQVRLNLYNRGVGIEASVVFGGDESSVDLAPRTKTTAEGKQRPLPFTDSDVRYLLMALVTEHKQLLAQNKEDVRP